MTKIDEQRQTERKSRPALREADREDVDKITKYKNSNLNQPPRLKKKIQNKNSPFNETRQLRNRKKQANKNKQNKQPKIKKG